MFCAFLFSSFVLCFLRNNPNIYSWQNILLFIFIFYILFDVFLDRRTEKEDSFY